MPAKDEHSFDEQELEALKALLDERRKGEFLEPKDARREIETMIAAKKKQLGL